MIEKSKLFIYFGVKQSFSKQLNRIAVRCSLFSVSDWSSRGFRVVSSHVNTPAPGITQHSAAGLFESFWVRVE